ncbi:uncharacterized protein LOC108683047, partial [Hyalella azteca]|uniref:Uncharacterized protein LOC108683047 n=1 Tax=Hyalella azteca TaxID=294128 RepID=A0A8B7PP92_HYAAZ
MASLRIMLIRGSLLVNMLVLTYLCITWLSVSEHRTPNSPPSQSHYRSLEAIVEQVSGRSPLYSPPYDSKRNEVPLEVLRHNEDKLSSASIKDSGTGNVDVIRDDQATREDIGDPDKNDMLLDGKTKGSKEESAIEKANIALAERESQLKMNPYYDPQFKEPPREVQESQGVTEQLHALVIPTDAPDPPPDSLEKKMYPDFRGCASRPLVPFHSQHGEFWILENYIPAALPFRCDESITYTTHGDYTFLDNLETLTSRWQGPVSISVYAPGNDFEVTISTILYLRDCWAEGIKKFVTFHLIYHTDHIPKKIPTTEELLGRKMDCSVEPPKWSNVTTYRQQKKLLYPVNVARNVARRMASTYFVFPSDVELYPSVNFIPEFFKMLKKPDVSNTTQPRVFVFSIFEVEESSSPPETKAEETKAELIKMLDSKKAIPFHQRVCASCHNIPHSK